MSLRKPGLPCLFLGRLLLAALTALVAAPPVRADEASDQYALAAGHYSRKRWSLAAEAFRAFLDAFPDHPQSSRAVFFLGEALIQMGRPEKAQAQFQAYLAQDPEGPYALQAQFRAGEAAYLAGRSDEARRLLEAFCNRYPTDGRTAHALAYLGEIDLASGDYPAAEVRFRRALAEFPAAASQDACRVGLARALEKRGNPQEAERLLLAVAAKPGSPLADDAQFRLGALQYAAGRLEDAMATWDAFAERFPKSPWLPQAQLSRAWTLVKRDRLDEARAVFQSLATDSQVGTEARYWLGLVEASRQDWKAAGRTLLEAAASDPDHPLVPAIRVHAGHALLEAGDAEAAEEQYQLAASASEDGGRWLDDALAGSLQASLAAADHAAVDRVASQFATRCPDSPLRPDVDRMVAQSLIERGQMEAAIARLEPLRDDSSDAGARAETAYLLAVAYQATGRAEDAQAALPPALENKNSPHYDDALLLQASLFLAAGEFESAIPPLETFLQTHPSPTRQAKALGQLALCFTRTGKSERARQALARLPSQPIDPQLLASIIEPVAEAAYDAGEADWSARLFGQLANTAPGRPIRSKAQAGLAWSQYQAGDLEAAEATFGQLLREEPPPDLAAEATLARGQILQKLGRTEDALAMYDAVIQDFAQSPQYADALLGAAQLRDQLGQDEAAADLYQRWIEQNSESPQRDAVLYQWAWTLTDSGQNEAAMGLFRQLHEEHPRSGYWADATYRLAHHAYDASDYPAARRLVRRLLEAHSGGAAQLDPTVRQNAMFLDAQIWAAQEDWPRAQESFSAFCQAWPESPLRRRARFWIAESAFRQGDVDTAGPLFEELADEEVAEPEPWLALCHLRLAQCLAQQEKWREAYDVASRIAERFPGFQQQYEADYVIGRYLAAQADFEQARAYYGKVCRSPEGDKTETAAEARFMIAESYFHQKKYDQALREYLAVEILYAFPVWQSAAVLQAGKCYEKLGDWQEAANQYARIIEVYGETEYVDEARRRLPGARARADRGVARQL